MKQTRYFLLTLLAALTLALAACGGAVQGGKTATWDNSSWDSALWQ